MVYLKFNRHKSAAAPVDFANNHWYSVGNGTAPIRFAHHGRICNCIHVKSQIPAEVQIRVHFNGFLECTWKDVALLKRCLNFCHKASQCRYFTYFSDVTLFFVHEYTAELDSRKEKRSRNEKHVCDIKMRCVKSGLAPVLMLAA